MSEIAKDVIATNFDTLAKTGGMNFERVVFLGTGSRLAASREAALKMLEMTAGGSPFFVKPISLSAMGR